MAFLGHSIYAIGAESVYPLSTSLISAHFSGRSSVFAISVINSVAKLDTCAVYFVAPKVSKPFIVTCLLGVVCFVAGTICMFLAKSAPSQGTYIGAKPLGQWYHSSKIVLFCLSFVFGATSLAPLNCHLSNLLQKSYLITAEKANAMIWGSVMHSGIGRVRSNTEGTIVGSGVGANGSTNKFLPNSPSSSEVSSVSKCDMAIFIRSSVHAHQSTEGEGGFPAWYKLSASFTNLARKSDTESVGISEETAAGEDPGKGKFCSCILPMISSSCNIKDSEMSCFKRPFPPEESALCSVEDEELTKDESDHLASMIQFRAEAQEALFRQVEASHAAKKRTSLIDLLEKRLAEEAEPGASFYSAKACTTLLQEMRDLQAKALELEASHAAEQRKQQREQEALRQKNLALKQHFEQEQKNAFDLVQVKVATSLQDLRLADTFLCKKDIPKTQRLLREFTTAKGAIQKKLASFTQKEAVRWISKSIPTPKELIARSKRISKEVASFWKKNEKEEKESRKRAEREEFERRKKEEEQREASRQSKKLNFLITQTELYTHFVLKKSNSAVDEEGSDSPLLTEAEIAGSFIDFDADADESLAQKARSKALVAASACKAHARLFDAPATEDKPMNLQSTSTTFDVQPTLLKCSLKVYRLKGLNWRLGCNERIQKEFAVVL